jgi:hypothetical protein
MDRTIGTNLLDQIESIDRSIDASFLLHPSIGPRPEQTPSIKSGKPGKLENLENLENLEEVKFNGF